MSVDPSSLIFVVIIGIWAVYLVQHWVRRREQLATSRSVDRFSAAMRVLERRAPIPVALPVSQNRTYVVASPVPAAPDRTLATPARPPEHRAPEVAMHRVAPADRPRRPTRPRAGPSLAAPAGRRRPESSRGVPIGSAP